MLNDKQIIVLLGIRDKTGIVEISKIFGRSQRTVQVLLEELERLGYIENTYGPNGGGKRRGRRLTQKAIELLRSLGHKT
jgi:DNA-binding MarR family transcriptional regulator